MFRYTELCIQVARSGRSNRLAFKKRKCLTQEVLFSRARQCDRILQSSYQREQAATKSKYSLYAVGQATICVRSEAGAGHLLASALEVG
jgi:hypothetical protein